ncbi:hypothetical protein Dda_1556 [Drechslerella dactyloides]|uniref:Uncharacterized protein n=1 Tax=Drechslerella dactyloides TaxID=74499 RepID=A0AAD6J203_DREDA|nr:hypothetical protein Dda_1556 [Drechslerella dactyloides]
MKTPTIVAIRSALSLNDEDYAAIRDTIMRMVQDPDFANASLDLNGSTEEERNEFCRAISDSLSASLKDDTALVQKLTVEHKDFSPWLLYKLVLLRRKRYKHANKGGDANISKDESAMDISTSSVDIGTPAAPAPSPLVISASQFGNENFPLTPEEPRSRSASPSKRTFSKIDQAAAVVGRVVHNKSQSKAAGPNASATVSTSGTVRLPPKKRIRREETEAAIASVTEARAGGKEIQVKKKRRARSKYTDEVEGGLSAKSGISWFPALCVTVIAIALGVWYVRSQG